MITSRRSLSNNSDTTNLYAYPELRVLTAFVIFPISYYIATRNSRLAINHSLKRESGTPDPDEAVGPSDGHGMMGHDDPENPQNWPLLKKVYVSSVGWSFTFVLLFGLTSYVGGISLVMKEFDITMVKAVLPFSLFLFGAFFAPIMTPHLSEKFGHMPVYLVSLPLMELFIVGASQSKSYPALAVTRFFAGFFGGPAVVLIEGTFADVWDAQFTSTYDSPLGKSEVLTIFKYSVLTTGSYLGAATGIIAGANVVFRTGNWRWTSYVQLIVAACVWLYGISALLFETHSRAIQRKIARKTGIAHKLPPPPTGRTSSEMITITLLKPLQSIVSDPLTIGMALYLSVNFAVLFQWFISVPVVLHKLTGFNTRQLGLGFIAALGGTFLGAISVILIDQVSVRTAHKNGRAIEHRMIPAMVGALLNIAAVFWVGWTATPKFDYHIPIVGTAVYVWGSAMTLIAFVSYLFDAFPARGTLIALTTAACARIVSAGWVSLIILMSLANIGGNWTFSIFGFIFFVFLPWPFVLYFFGPKIRAKSRLGRTGPQFTT